MNKEEFSLDIDMSKADMSKLKDLLTSTLGLRHFAFQLKTGEYLDLVEYKDYEKLEKELEQLKEIEKEHQRINGNLRVEIKELEKENQELKDRIDKAIEYINKKAIKKEIQETRNIVNIIYSLKLNNYEFIELEDILKGDKE